MIKFFHDIRYNLMEKNKTGKYLKYAVGEIILVMIGILLALQVNNWNEGRKDNLREHAILIQLEQEYNTNLKQLEAKMQLRSSVITSGLSLLKYMNSPKVIARDSVILHLGFITSDPTFDPIQNDLISSGNIRLIHNQKLKNLLSNWSSDVLALQEQEEINQMHVHQVMRPLFHEIGITRDILNKAWGNWDGSGFGFLDENNDMPKLEFGKSLHNINAQEILANKKVEGVVSNTISVNYAGNLESLSLKERIVEILELIKADLNQ